MDSTNPSGSPLETVADQVGKETTNAFELLSNETRLAILLALWEAADLGPPFSETSLSFSELREWVGNPDSGQFNYHLDRLEGRYVSETDEGYRLTLHAHRILQAVLAGTLTDQAFEGGPIDDECPRCGTPAMVVVYDERGLGVHCTNCERGWSNHQFAPAGLVGRTPGEVRRAGLSLITHRMLSLQEGVCPICAGTVTTSIFVCTDHDPEDGTLCERCGHALESLIPHRCDICKHQMNAHPNWFAYGIPGVRAFFYDHGFDVVSRGVRGVPTDVQEFEVLSAEPPKLRLRAELDGDRLDVTLDDDARVIDVVETTT